MNREQLDSYLAQKEREYNLRPGEFRAVWQQESSGSTDPSLKGPTLPGNKGKAVGPFQVVPYFHPGFDPSAPVDKQADYAISFYAGSGETPEQRLRRYYGTGTPMKGQPTTDQYVRQVSARMGGYGSQPEQQMPRQMPQEQQMDPNTERQQFQPNYIPVPEPINYEDLPQVPARRELTGVEKWLANPLTQMGAAIMAASGSPLGAPIGYGVASAASGLGDAQKAENELYELQLKREQARRQLMSEDRKSRMEAMDWNQKQAAMAQLMTLADQYEAKGDPLTAAKIRAGIKSGLDENFSLTPKFIYDPETKTTKEITYSSTGKRVERDLGRTVPLGESPELKGAQAAAAASGRTQGEAIGTDFVNAQTAIDSANKQIANLTNLRDHPGAKWETGLVSNIPFRAVKGTEAYDYNALQENVLGEQFKAGFDALKGAGAISEKEGAAALAAQTALKSGLSEKERNRQIDLLIGIAERGRAKADAKLRAGGGTMPFPPTLQQPTPAAPATKAPAASTPPAQAPKGGGGWGFKRID